MRRSERTGVLVLRMWIEPGAEDGLRARITASDDLGSEERTSVVAADVDEILRIVRAWVDAFVARA